MSVSITFIKTTKKELIELQMLKKNFEEFESFQNEEEETKYYTAKAAFRNKLDKVTIAKVECGFALVRNLRCVMLASVGSPLLWEYIDTHKSMFDLNDTWRESAECFELNSENDDLLQAAITGTFAYWFNSFNCLVSMLEFKTDLNIIGEKNQYTLKTSNEFIKQIENFKIGYHGREYMTNNNLRKTLSKSNGLFISEGYENKGEKNE